MSLRHIAAVASVFKTGTDWLREKCACLNFRTVTFGAGWKEAKLGDKIATYWVNRRGLPKQTRFLSS